MYASAGFLRALSINQFKCGQFRFCVTTLPTATLFRKIKFTKSIILKTQKI